eukprot:8237585-Pyramimonas_sp.AAC.1
MTSFYGSSCANNGTNALNTPDLKQVHYITSCIMYAADTAGIRELMVKTPSSRPLGSFWRPPRLNRYQVAQEIYTFLYEGEVQVRQAPESTAKKAVDFNSTVDCRH